MFAVPHAYIHTPTFFAHVIHYSFSHSCFINRIPCTRSFPFLPSYRSVIFTSSFSHAVFLSRSLVRYFFCFFFFSFFRIKHRYFIIVISRYESAAPFLIFLFVCLFVCFFFVYLLVRSLKFSVSFMFPFYFCRIRTFHRNATATILFSSIFSSLSLSLSLFLFVYLFFVFRFVIKNVHLLMLKLSSIVQIFFISLIFFKIQQHTIRIWLYRCSLALQLKRVSYEGLTVRQWRCRHLD